MASTSIALTTLSDVINRASARWPQHRSRIERAGTLLVLGNVERTDATTYTVRSQTDASSVYTVTADACECIDSQRQPSPCKHRWAVRLLEIAEERERILADRETARRAEQAARARFSADRVAISYARAINFGRRAA